MTTTGHVADARRTGSYNVDYEPETEIEIVETHHNNNNINYYYDDDDDDDDGETLTNAVAVAIVRYYTPAVIVVGLIGNGACLATLRATTTLRRRPTAHFLSAVCAADTVFLACLLVMSAGAHGYDIFNRDGWCEFLSLATMASNFLVIWYLVAMAVERYLVVVVGCGGGGGGGGLRRGGDYEDVDDFRRRRRKSLTTTMATSSGNDHDDRSFSGGGSAPVRRRHRNHHRKLVLLTVGRSQLVIVGLAVVAVVVYVNIVINIGVVVLPDGAGRLCIPLPVAQDAMRILSNLDFVVNVVVPYVVVAVLFAIIAARLTVSRYRRRRAIGLSTADRLLTEVCPTAEIKLTKMAATLTGVVLLLAAPSHALRVAYHAMAVPVWRHRNLTVQLVQLLYAAYFAAPFFVVVVSYDIYRKWLAMRLRRACCCCFRRSVGGIGRGGGIAAAIIPQRRLYRIVGEIATRIGR